MVVLMKLPPRSLALVWILALGSVAACAEGTAGDESEEGSFDTTGSSSGTEGSSSESVTGESGDGDGDTTDSGDTESGGDGDTGGDGDGGTSGDGDGDASVWQPTPGTTWQWQLQGSIDISWDVAMYDIDLFDVPEATITGLQDAGRVVICYFSAGSYEEWRPDADDFPSSVLGNPLDGWPGEVWIDFRDQELRDVMAARLDLAVEKGCDGVEPDNVDGYTNDPGFPLTAADQLDYNTWMANQAHARGLSIGLKNDLDQVEALEPLYDWALNEECQSWNECDMLQPFLDANKAVFHVEYVDQESQGAGVVDTVCPPALALNFSTLIKTWDLLAWGIPCE
jgi:hypothetical protein